MSVPTVGIHRLIDAGRRLQKYEDQPCVCTGKRRNRKHSIVARSCEKTPAAIWTIDFVQGISWFGDNPCRKYTENQGNCDRKKLAKNTKNKKVYAQQIQEIQRKPKFFDRSLKPGQTKNAPPRKDLCSGFKFIYDKYKKPRQTHVNMITCEQPSSKKDDILNAFFNVGASRWRAIRRKDGFDTAAGHAERGALPQDFYLTVDLLFKLE